MARIVFYFDLGSPYAYLTAERLPEALPEPVRWQTVLLGGLFGLSGRSSWALGDDHRRRAGIAEIERRARSYGLPPVKWPDPWPGDYLTAMRAATFAFRVGRGREFTLAAFREAFQRGRDLGSAAGLAGAARAAGLDPGTVRLAGNDADVKHALRRATEEAYARGVFGVPTIAIDDELFWGDDRLEDAAAHLRAIAPHNDDVRAG
ncbi:MAG: DsbA family protein [Solirubrobacteraceae bacterium]|jgi:2-hydroxychromene-2-carboxylate isomerase